MFKAEKTSTIPAGDALSVSQFSLLVKFASPVMLTIVLAWSKIRVTLKSNA